MTVQPRVGCSSSFRQPLGIAQLDKRRGVPATGEYVIRFSARAIHRNSRYKDEDLRFNSEEPMRLSISIDSRELGATAHRIIGEYEIPDDRIIEIEHRVWLEKGFTFHVHWANGPNGSFKRILRKIFAKIQQKMRYTLLVIHPRCTLDQGLNFMSIPWG